MSCIVCEKVASFTCTCGTGICLSCAKQWKPQCTKCEKPFTLNDIPKSFVSVYKEHKQTEFWEREKNLFPNTQALVDWEIKTEHLKTRIRFGEAVRFPPKPNLNVSSDGMFPCPLSSCRGFVLVNKCGVCKCNVCRHCRELKEENHVCDPDNLTSVAEIVKDSRPCPKCSVPIFRMYGCDHMNCTHCGIHWNWETRAILSHSSNHHYPNTPFRVDQHHCEDITLKNPPDTKLLRWLEDTSANTILQTVYTNFKYNENLINIRLQYLRGKIDEKGAKLKIYTLETQLLKHQEVAELLQFYLSSINYIKKEWQDSRYKDKSELLINLITTCNDIRHKIISTYGGTVPIFQLNEGPTCSF